jgi:medium-chain acyl-[acyl-carrier-protein] hydrolase
MPRTHTIKGRPLRIERRSPWLLAMRHGDTVDRRLFCFPYAGGGASTFRKLVDTVPTRTEVCAVQLPGREDRYSETAFVRMPALVAAVAAELTRHTDRPFAFFGHSMGALVAYELTRALSAAGGPLPLHVFASGRRAPHLAGRRRALHALPLGEMKAELRNLQGTPGEVLDDPELMELVEPILRADFEVCETYAHLAGTPLQVPVSAFGGSEDPEATPEELEAWGSHTTRFAGVRMFSGHHFYLQQQWRALGEAIGAELTRSVPR